MSARTPRPFGLFALVATLLVSAMGVGVPADTARAEVAATRDSPDEGAIKAAAVAIMVDELRLAHERPA
jgi:hypothetical protein